VELNSDVQVEVTSENFSTVRLLKINDMNFKILTQKVVFDDIIEKHQLISFEIIGKGFRYSTFDKLTSFENTDLEKFQFNTKRKKRDIHKDIMHRINDTVNIFTDEALDNVYGNILDSNNLLQQFDELYGGLDGNNKLKLLNMKLGYKKKYSPIDRNRFDISNNVQEFKDMYTIGFKIFQVKVSTYEKFRSISYIDLLIVIITMFIIYLSLYLFNTKFRKHVTLNKL